MKSKKGWTTILQGMFVFGMIIEAVRDGIVTHFSVPKQTAFQVTGDRWIWNPFNGVQWSCGLAGFLADSVALGVCLILIIGLFANTRETAHGSMKQAVIGTILGGIMVMAIMPGVTLVQLVWFAAVISLCFGIALGIDLIGHAELFGSFGIMLGINTWTFFLYGGMIALTVTAALVAVNLGMILLGYLIGCCGVGVKELVARKR